MILTGQVISTKWKDGSYGPQLKMILKTDDGDRYWGTVPKALRDDDTDEPIFDSTDRVSITVTSVSDSDDDPTFHFYSRPTDGGITDRGVYDAIVPEYQSLDYEVKILRGNQVGGYARVYTHTKCGAIVAKVWSQNTGNDYYANVYQPYKNEWVAPWVPHFTTCEDTAAREAAEKDFADDLRDKGLDDEDTGQAVTDKYEPVTQTPDHEDEVPGVVTPQFVQLKDGSIVPISEYTQAS
jgi:hypothetical protein